MKLICISNKIFSDGVQSEQLSLTLGKIYDGYKTLPQNIWGNYLVRNDIGNLNYYSSIIFMSLDEWREKQLKELGILCEAEVPQKNGI